jgi:regulator of ribonuclease activity A
MQWSCADLCDKYGDSVNYCESFPFKHFSQKRKFHGEIETVKCFEDNSRVKELLATPGNGRVLVVDGQGSHRRALLGDLIADSAIKSCWTGVIINGVIRDSVAISSLDGLGVCALGTNPRKSDRKGAGTSSVTVEFAGLKFTPGDHVYVDEDGIIVSNKMLSL